MYFYSFVMAFPEGIDWSVELAHVGKFDDDEFHSLCEKSLLRLCQLAPGKLGHSLFSSSDAAGFIQDYMIKEFGFIRVEQTSVYCIDQFWGQESVKDPELRELMFPPGKEAILPSGMVEEEEDVANQS